jgi:hypothetical protein
MGDLDVKIVDEDLSIYEHVILKKLILKNESELYENYLHSLIHFSQLSVLY